ncbi:hypothetical protein EPUS_00425 [Endocarpon pusillum Z07020]|uniref:Uncharacterized protein n=1 Tax=Endocarpon pusillum (strain Z07020 / HMAS-L-300199) TaxID=1263415 RepID=U1FZ84_ENDPU|nr:uncharacterized protein EPUS_00425 [Endocarpon pusillum Z07020]ERF70237.1 hypothetical protein EPUS_00425 [Endocarpon pusillum Z07020]
MAIDLDSDREALIDREGTASNHAHESVFTYPKRSILYKRIPRFIGTVTFLSLVVVTLKFYADAGNISDRRKTGFNVIITILSLFLGLNFFEVFKDMARIYRWRVLTKISFNLREFVLILDGENLMNLLRLMRESRTRPFIVFACLAWIALNLLAQGSIALINLTYDVDGGNDATGTIFRPGMVLVPKLDCYYNYEDLCPIFEEAPQVLAHSFGEAITSQPSCNYTSTASILDYTRECYYFRRHDRQEYAFRYSEHNPNDKARAYPYLTDRIITASPGGCRELNITKTSRVDDPDGRGAVTRFELSNSPYSSNITVNNAHLAHDATTYIYQGFKIPQHATIFDCGDRCMVIYALRQRGGVRKEPDRVFECTITISSVTNVSDPVFLEHHVPDDIARLAAASIALQGRYQNPFRDETKRWWQSQLYPWASKWETDGLSAQEIGGLISEFAIGSLATMAHLNPTTTMPGTLPILASRVRVTWWGIISLAVCIASTHALLVLVMLWVSKAVIVPDDGSLVIDMLLKSAAGRLGASRSLGGGERIALAIHGGREGESKETIELAVIPNKGAHSSREESSQATRPREADPSRRVAYRIVRDEAGIFDCEIDESLSGRDSHGGQESA